MRRALKTIVKPVAKAVLQTPLPEWVFRYRARRKLTVIAYHRIMPLPGGDYPFDEGVISASPEEFARELQFFKRHLDVLSVPELVEAMERPENMPERPALITFDDGYIDNYEYAFPLLREAGLPACFFITTRYVNTPVIPWWDYAACCLKKTSVKVVPSPFGAEDPPFRLDDSDRREATIRRFLHGLIYSPWEDVQSHLDYLREKTGIRPEEYLERPLFMSWDQAREMARAGMHLGGHTQTHPVLGRVGDPVTLRREIHGCFEDLLRETGQAPLAFAYPVGRLVAVSKAADEEIRRAGFRLRFSFEHGFARLDGGKDRNFSRLVTEYGADYDAFRLGMSLAPTLS